MMVVTIRVPARELAADDHIGGFIAHAVDHVDAGAGVGYAMVRWGITGKPDSYYSYGGFVTIGRPMADKVECPECGDPMSERRLDERALAVTQGICSECVAYPRRHAEQVARERAIAAFGEGRC